VTTSGAFSPDGRSLAFASGMQAFVADLKSGEVTSMTPTFSTPVTPDTTVTGSQVVWSPDGQSLVTAFGLVTPEEEVPGEITLWKRMEDGSFKEVDHTANIAAGYAEQGRSLAIFDPSGSRVALESRLSYGLEGVELRVIDVASGRVGQTYPGYRPKGWAGDDLLLATDNQNDTRLVRFNLLTGEQTTRYLEGTNVFTFSPNGLFIAQLGTAGRSLILLDGLAEEITRFKEGSASVDDFGWSPDGRWLYSAGNDGTLKIWPVISNG
jgi:WD40 repeat protein